MSDHTLADVCVVACAEAWRGDGELLASPFGVVPSIGARLARATFEPDLVLSDGEAALAANVVPVGPDAPEPEREAWLPYRSMFDLVWSGRRHVMMGATQVDRFGNQNISCIGDWARPARQLIGVRGAPGNTVNHPTSYWIPNHSPRVFVERVDFVSGVGFDSAAAAGASASRYHCIRRIVTNLAVLDFETEDRAMRLRSLHPGVSLDDVVEATGFALAIEGEVEETRVPSGEELRLITEVIDPGGKRFSEVRP